MKKRTQFLSGMVAALCLVSLLGSAFAAYRTQQATLEYPGVKITLNGQTVTPTDANGNTVEPFIINGTTYLPVRAVSGALGLDVDWDSATKTVVLSGGASGSEGSGSLDAYYLANELTFLGYRAQLTADSIYENGLMATTLPTISAAEVKRACAIYVEQLNSMDGLLELITGMVRELEPTDSTLASLCSDMKYALIDLRVPNDAIIEMADAGLTNTSSTSYTNAYNVFWDYYSDGYDDGLGNLQTITSSFEERATALYDALG